MSWVSYSKDTLGVGISVRVLVFNATFNSISVISWRSVVLVEKAGVPIEKPPTCHKSLTNFFIAEMTVL